MLNQIQINEEALYKVVSREPSLHEALGVLNRVAPEHARTIRRHLFTDSLMEGVGNKKAFNDFLNRHGNSGVHVSIDGNAMGSREQAVSEKLKLILL